MESSVELVKDYLGEHPEAESLIQYAIECQKIYELTLIAMGQGPKISIESTSCSTEGSYSAHISRHPE